jgi:hypothetical protein
MQKNNDVDQIVNVTFSTGDILFFTGTNDTASVEEDSDQSYVLLDDIHWISSQTPRVFVTAICCMLIYLYTFYLLTWEWIENVSLRRRYFLEATHYSQRMGELNKMALEKIKNDSLVVFNSADCPVSDESIAARHYLEEREVSGDADRPEFLPHPEIRETPPSIGLFSVLFQLPASMVTYDTEGATALEREMVATRNFFDEIIRPEAGFSSSVVAVTILPEAKRLAVAQKKWDICEKKLQQLRHVRKNLRRAKRRQADYEHKALELQKKMRVAQSGTSDVQQQEQKENPLRLRESTQTIPTKNTTAKIIGSRVGVDGSIASFSSNEKSLMVGEDEEEDDEMETPREIEISNEDSLPLPIRISTAAERGSSSLLVDKTPANNGNSIPRNSVVFRYEDFDVAEYATSIGFYEEVHDMVDFVDGMGIEEFNVFAYKCSLIAGSNPGNDKRMFNVLGIESLEKEEKDLIEELRVANQELLDARESVVMIDEEKELKESEQPSQPSIRCEDEEDTVDHYSVYESPGEFSIGLRQRKTTPSGIGNDSEAIFRSQDTKEVSVSRDDPISKSIMQLLWNTFKSLLIVPKRVLIGKVGSENYKERQKYYGAPHPSDTETGRGKGFVTNINRPSYAVVTFATRQAAIIARQCLADGSARNRWKQVDHIPIYPLADAPPWAVG